VAEIAPGAIAWPLGGEAMGDLSRAYPVRA